MVTFRGRHPIIIRIAVIPVNKSSKDGTWSAVPDALLGVIS